MKISVEISMYPLSPDYKPPIIAFVKALRAHSDIQVQTNGMSTQVYGDYDRVTQIIQAEVKKVFVGEQKVSMVMKWLNDDVSGPISF